VHFFRTIMAAQASVAPLAQVGIAPQAAPALVAAVPHAAVLAQGVVPPQAAVASPVAQALTEDQIEAAAKDMLSEDGMEDVTSQKFKKMLARKLGVDRKHMDAHSDFVKKCVKDFWKPAAKLLTPTQRVAALVEALGGEAGNSKQSIHFVTVSRVLPDTLGATDLVDVTKMTRQQNLILQHLFL